MKSGAPNTNDPGFLSGSEPSVYNDSNEKAAGAEKKLKGKEQYPGILEEGLVYSCAGPRVDPEEA